MTTTWAAFVQAGLDKTRMSASELAYRVRIDKSAISSWLNKGAMPRTTDTMRAVAEAFGLPPIEGLLAAGAVTADELGVRQVAPNPDLLSDRDIIAQVEKRFARSVQPQRQHGQQQQLPFPPSGERHLRAARRLPGKGLKSSE